MSEADLVGMLQRGARRIRACAGARWACGALLAGLALAAAWVVVARVRVEWAGAILPAFWLPPLLALAAGLFGFWRARPSPAAVALTLDRRAGLAEHLATWEEFRRLPAPAEPLDQAFVAAQRQAALRCAEGLDPARHLPVSVPAWSRALWLGLLALACALLMPPQEPRSAGAQGPQGAPHGSQRPEAGRFTPFSPAPLPDALRVEVLTPTEFFKYQLAAGSLEVPESVKARALEELEAKIGALPESELSPQVRAVLEALREQVGQRKSSEGPQGSIATTGSAPEPVHAQPAPPPRPEALPPSPVELVALAKDRFPDVAAALERYYLGDGR